MGLIRLKVFGGHDDELAGESEFQGVEAGSLLAGFGFGAGGVLGVRSINFCSVDFRAVWCRHLRVLSLLYSIGGIAEGLSGSRK